MSPAGPRLPFETVVERHGPTVLRVVRAVLGPGPDADDAWSEAFLAALRAWPDLPVDVRVEAWLVTVAHRKALDVTRRRARHAVPLADPPPPREAPVTGPPAPGSGRHVRDLDLTAAVAALPPRQREAVAYHHLAGLTHVEVAALVGRTPAAVRRAAADGIATLRRTTTRPEDP